MDLAHPGRPLFFVGRYAVYEEIAAGGMATVHLGRFLGDAGFQKTVAIKRLHPNLAKDPDFREMLVDEARLAARIVHPNAAATLDVVAEGGELVLVLEYIHGESFGRLLKSAVRRGDRVPPRIAAAILAGVLHGLHAAHEAADERGAPLGIVHRDVSPQNILVGADGAARVIDFGVAKAAGKVHQTREGQVKGKLAYMSPEQLRGEAIDRRADVYAAGVVLWEALTGERLYTGSGEEIVFQRLIDEDIAPPSRRVTSLPPGFDAVAMRALERDPEQRYATAHDMAVALEAAGAFAPPSEVSAWVMSLAGEALEARQSLIRTIERQGPAVPLDPTVDELPPPLRPTEVDLSLSAYGASAIEPAPFARRRASRSSLWLVAIIAAIAAGSFAGARSALSPKPDARSEPPARASFEITTPVALSADPVTSAEAPDRAPVAVSAAPTPVPPPRPPTSQKIAPSPAKTAVDGCNPPFTIEPSGRKRYKRECL